MTDLSREAARAKTLDWAFARIKELETELASFEKVVVATSITPHTLSVYRADGTREHVESGVALYAKAGQP